MDNTGKRIMDHIIENESFDQERSLYHLQDCRVIGCTFAGPADGESALKEARNVTVKDCHFSLRYPLWHTQGFRLLGTDMDVLTRAPMWYASRGGDRGLRYLWCQSFEGVRTHTY